MGHVYTEPLWNLDAMPHLFQFKLIGPNSNITLDACIIVKSFINYEYKYVNKQRYIGVCNEKDVELHPRFLSGCVNTWLLGSSLRRTPRSLEL
jgi:hypothetical protein